MIIALEPFAVGSVERRFGADLGRGVDFALRHYARRVSSQRRPPEVPLFMRGVAVDREAATEIEVSPPYEVFLALSGEARRQEVEFDRIVAHAVFVYLDDIGAGAAEEVGASPRSAGHAASQPSSPRRPRGKEVRRSLLRGGRSTGGRSRFGRR